MGIAAQEVQKLVHKAHLRRADFERHGYTDRCAGCSAILRGLHVQPHSDQCRQRIEKLLEDDVRVKNAKVRLEERGKRVRGEPNGEQVDIKKAQLDDLGAQAMSENDQSRLGEVYSKYRAIYTEWKAEKQDRDLMGKRMQGESSGELIDNKKTSWMIWRLRRWPKMTRRS